MLSKDEFDKCVLDVWHSILTSILGTDYDKSELQIIDDPQMQSESAVLIGIFGDIEGIFVMEFCDDTVLKFVDKMNNQLKTFIETENVIKGVFGEIANILTSKVIQKSGMKFGNTILSTPSRVQGQSITVNLFYGDNYQSFIKTEFGIIKIIFALNSI